MKKTLIALLILLLACVGFTGCTGQNPAEVSAAQDSPIPSSVPTDQNAGVTVNGITLKEIREATEAAGYPVSDGHQLVFMKDVDDGFTVEIVADGQDTLYSVIECKTEDAAIKNAKDIDDAGYNIALRSGKILTCYNADIEGVTTKKILESILAGKPISNE